MESFTGCWLTYQDILIPIFFTVLSRVASWKQLVSFDYWGIINHTLLEDFTSYSNSMQVFCISLGPGVAQWWVCQWLKKITVYTLAKMERLNLVLYHNDSLKNMLCFFLSLENRNNHFIHMSLYNIFYFLVSLFQNDLANSWILPIMQGFVQIEMCKVDVGYDFVGNSSLLPKYEVCHLLIYIKH